MDPAALPTEASIQEIHGVLASDSDRLRLSVSDARKLVGEGRAAVILTERRDHLERLAGSLCEDVPNLVVLHGGVKPKARRAALRQLADLPDDGPRLVVATGRYIGEGFDDPRLDTLLLAMPIAWKGTVVQHAGRLHRLESSRILWCNGLISSVGGGRLTSSFRDGQSEITCKERPREVLSNLLPAIATGLWRRRAAGPALTNTDGHRLKFITGLVRVENRAAAAERLAAHQDFRTEEDGEVTWWGRELTEMGAVVGLV